MTSLPHHLCTMKTMINVNVWLERGIPWDFYLSSMFSHLEYTQLSHWGNYIRSNDCQESPMASRSLRVEKREPKSDPYCVQARRGREKVGGTGQAQADQVDRDCSPTSHPWTLTLIEKSMKNRWSLWWPPSLTLPVLSTVPHVLSLPAWVTRSGLHADAVLACACPAAHKVYQGWSNGHDRSAQSASVCWCVCVRQRQHREGGGTIECVGLL